MKALLLTQYGGPDAVRYDEIAMPQPAPEELLVRVNVAGINPADWKIREGYLKDMIPLGLPIALGMDFSGTVEKVGSGISNFKAGDDVFGSTGIARLGAFAQFLTAPQSACVHTPKSLSSDLAAAIPTPALAAWAALYDANNIAIAKGQTILIHGGAGGVGSFAIQFAKARGAAVIATGSPRNHEYLKRLGADIVVDYNKERFEDAANNVDAVLDTIGGDTLVRSLEVIKKGGVLASVAQPPDSTAAERRGVKAVWVVGAMEPLLSIGEMVAAGTIRVEVTRTVPLAEGREALRLSQAGHVQGKIVLHVAH